MHIVAAAVDTPTPLESVLTANASREQLRRVLPRMQPVDDLAAPGPARVATIELSTGQRVSLVFHERKNFIEILTPTVAGIETGLADLLVELDIPVDAVTWTHDRIDLPAMLARLTAASHP